MIKATYEKLTANMWLKTESFLSKIRNKTKTPPFTTSIQQSTRSPSQSNEKRKKKMKGIQNTKEEVRLSIF